MIYLNINLFTKVDMKRSVFTLRCAHCLLWRLYKQSFFEGMYGPSGWLSTGDYYGDYEEYGDYFLWWKNFALPKGCFSFREYKVDCYKNTLFSLNTTKSSQKSETSVKVFCMLCMRSWKSQITINMVVMEMERTTTVSSVHHFSLSYTKGSKRSIKPDGYGGSNKGVIWYVTMFVCWS